VGTYMIVAINLLEINLKVDMSFQSLDISTNNLIHVPVFVNINKIVNIF